MFASKILEEKTSKYNGNLKVVRTFGMGTYIQSNSLTQSGGIVEAIWKQTIRKIYSQKKDIDKILILGYGGGTIGQLVTKIWPKANIIGIDIDPMIVELGEKYIGLKNDNTKVIIGDAFDWVKNVSEKYDLIFVDLYRGDKFPEKFKSLEFVNTIKKGLSGNGMVVFNRLYYGDKRPETVKFGNNLQKHFSKVTWFYPEANLMFLCLV